MASEVEICNMALSSVRGKSINSLGESSTEAQQCNLWYSKCRDQVLTEIDWGFNTIVVALAQLTAVSVFNWGRVWAYPTDCLRINHVMRNIPSITTSTASPGDSAIALRLSNDIVIGDPSVTPRVQYRVMYDDGVKVIVTNEDTIRISYRSRITDANLFGVNVELAISQLLASKIAIAVAGVKDGKLMKVDSLALYGAWLSKAQDDTANERYQPEQDSDYIQARL